VRSWFHYCVRCNQADRSMLVSIENRTMLALRLVGDKTVRVCL
jgi:hypothetical protein